MTKILLVGTGLTSAVTGSILRQELPKAELVMWDKARGAGGRMSTIRNNKDPQSTMDLGAQYISATPDYAELHKSYYEELKTLGVLAPLTSKVDGMKTVSVGTQHFVTPHGTSSIVKHFLNKSNSQVKFGYHVQGINFLDKKWEVSTLNGVKDTFDVVVLTMPVPQILCLSGDIKELLKTKKQLGEQLLSVEYSARYALGLFYPKGSPVSLADGNSAQYITNDSILRYVAIDNLKRGIGDSCPSVVAHTSVVFGKANVEKTPEEVQPTIVAKVKEMFPKWPEPEAIKCQKWRFSQVRSAFPGLPGVVEIERGLLAGGDGFTHSNMDGCIESAKVIANAVVQYVKSDL